MSTLDLSDEQLDWIAERMPSAGRLTTAEDAVRAYQLRRQHTSYRTLRELFACSRSSLRRAIVLVAAQRGDDPEQWRSMRQANRRRQVASFYAHRAQITVRRNTIADEVRALRGEQRVDLPLAEPALDAGPRDAYAEQARLQGTPQPERRAMPGTPARGAVNHFARRAPSLSHPR